MAQFKYFNFRKLPYEMINEDTDFKDTAYSSYKGPIGSWALAILVSDGFIGNEEVGITQLVKFADRFSNFKVYPTDNPDKFSVVWTYDIGRGIVTRGGGDYGTYKNKGIAELVKLDNNGNMNMYLRYWYPYTNNGGMWIEENYGVYYNLANNYFIMKGNSDGNHLLISLNYYHPYTPTYYYNGWYQYGTSYKKTLWDQSSVITFGEPIPDNYVTIVKFKNNNNNNPIIGKWERRENVSSTAYYLFKLDINENYICKFQQSKFKNNVLDPGSSVEWNGILTADNRILLYGYNNILNYNYIINISYDSAKDTIYHTDDPSISYNRVKNGSPSKIIIAKSINKINLEDKNKNNYKTMNINFKINIPISNISMLPIYVLTISSYIISGNNIDGNTIEYKNINIYLFSNDLKKIPSDTRLLNYSEIINNNEIFINDKVSDSNITLSDLFNGYNDSVMNIRFEYDGTSINMIWIKNPSTSISLGKIDNVGIFNDNISFSINHLKKQTYAGYSDGNMELLQTNIQNSDIYYN
jgi:hypothetical protein